MSFSFTTCKFQAYLAGELQIIFNNIITKFLYNSEWTDKLITILAKVKVVFTAADQMHYFHKSIVKMGTTQK